MSLPPYLKPKVAEYLQKFVHLAFSCILKNKIDPCFVIKVSEKPKQFNKETIKSLESIIIKLPKAMSIQYIIYLIRQSVGNAPEVILSKAKILFIYLKDSKICFGCFHLRFVNSKKI